MNPNDKPDQQGGGGQKPGQPGQQQPGKAANRAVAVSRSSASRLNANWSLRWRCFPG
jgi:hypothetical protein